MASDRFFKEFPPEVKEMIWVCAATSFPRTVTIKLDENSEMRVAQTIPALLHTNKHGTRSPELPLALHDLDMLTQCLSSRCCFDEVYTHVRQPTRYGPLLHQHSH